MRPRDPHGALAAAARAERPRARAFAGGSSRSVGRPAVDGARVIRGAGCLVGYLVGRAPKPSRLRAVHIDSLQPEKHAQFIDARKEWVAELRRIGANDGRGLYMEAGAGRVYSMHPLARFGSLDPEPVDPRAPAEPEPSEAAGKRYDDLCDSALAFPHTSEIWRLSDALSYTPDTGALTEQTADFGTLIIDDVRADSASEGRYWKATGEINEALKAAAYPLTRVGYRTVYGAGHVYTFVLAPTAEALASAPKLLDVLTHAKGAAGAAAILAEIDATVAHRESLPITVRHDLTIP